MSVDIAPLCAVVIATDLTEVIKAVSVAKTELIELRLDYITPLCVDYLAKIKQSCKKPTIITCRSKEHGGQFDGTVEQQTGILQAANDAGFEFIDIDISLASKVKLSHLKAKRILSYHNFCSTPSLKALQDIKLSMQNQQADIMKFAVQTNNPNDNKTLLKFLLDKKEHEKMIVLGMGRLGRITRLLGPLLGGYLTFCNNESVEPGVGHVSEKELRSIFSSIHNFM